MTRGRCPSRATLPIVAISRIPPPSCVGTLVAARIASTAAPLDRLAREGAVQVNEVEPTGSLHPERARACAAGSVLKTVALVHLRRAGGARPARPSGRWRDREDHLRRPFLSVIARFWQSGARWARGCVWRNVTLDRGRGIRQDFTVTHGEEMRHENRPPCSGRLPNDRDGPEARWPMTMIGELAHRARR